MSAVVLVIGHVVAEPFQSRTNFRLVSSIGIVVSFTPCEMKIFGLPRAATGLKTPGDIAMTWPKTSPAPIPNDSEYTRRRSGRRP